MLEKIDLSKTIDEGIYKKRITELRARLYVLQRQCWDAGVPSILVFEGWGASGRGAMVNFLTQNLEPRVFRLHMILAPRTAEESMPWLWRFWVKIPNRGEMAIFDQSWYRRVLIDRVEKRVSKMVWKQAFEDINDFERALADDGYLIHKVFLHISRDEQKRRLKALAKDPISKKMRDPEDRLQQKHYKNYFTAVEEMLMRTETEWAPWTIVEANDARFARVKVFETAIQRLEWALARRRGEAVEMLENIDLTQKVSEKEYEYYLPLYQAQMRELAYQLYLRKRLLIVVYEGWDAAGKGGNIRRVTARLDPRGYEVFAISAPSGEDKTHHYLWRFWRRLHPPEEKQVLIFDRSWYGRVLVERVEGFAQEHEWKRAYREINHFERQLTDSGAIIVKFWMHISPQEQLKRFKEREDKPYKSWKLTGEDWRNRDKWPQYNEAVDEMLLKTSTIHAPWTIVEGNYKWFARVKCLRALVERTSRELNYRPRIYKATPRTE